MAIGSYQGMWAEWSASGAGERSSGHIPFQCNSVFLNIALRSLNTLSAARSTQNAPLVIC